MNQRNFEAVPGDDLSFTEGSIQRVFFRTVVRIGRVQDLRSKTALNTRQTCNGPGSETS